MRMEVRAACAATGIRCVGKYAYDHGIVDKPQISVETLGGIKYLDMRIANGKVKTVKVDMGIPQLTSELPEKIQVDGKKLEFTGIDVGNPHAVYYVDDVDQPGSGKNRSGFRDARALSGPRQQRVYPGY